MKYQNRPRRPFGAGTLFLGCMFVGGLMLGAGRAESPNIQPKDADAKRVSGPDLRATSETDAPSKDQNQKKKEDATAPNASKKIKPVGHPLAPGMMVLLEEEIAAGLKRRNIEPQFNRFCHYAAQKLDSTAGLRRTSEVTGNCRLNWYDAMLRQPLKAPAQAEKFTRDVHQALQNDHQGLEEVLTIATAKLDLNGPQPRKFSPVASPQEALEAVKRTLTDVQVAYSAALAPLTRGEIGELAERLYPVLTSQNKVGHTLTDRYTGRRMCDLLEKLDREAMMTAARALVPLTDPRLLEQLSQLPEEGQATVEGTTGRILKRIVTPAGDIVIGGKGANAYQLDEMQDVNVVIDLGGDDTYYEGVTSIQRPTLIVIDLDGDDTYRGSRPGIQAGAILGVAMLLDFKGDDTYQAADMAQGSCLGGVGLLIDYAGDDSYVGVRRVQGHALGGVGMLIDRGGSDRYHAAMWAQGFGGPLGFGVLEDFDGDDHYFAGGLYYDSYEETPGYEGWAQGVGAGIRQVANGGIGAILDGGGDDVYEFDYLSHGGGYWLGLGFARDFGGNDQRLGATRTAYNGSNRTERRFQRFGNGFGCHYALGFCFDDMGNDTYNGTIMNVGFAWDVAVGVLCDFDGDDDYGGTQGNGAQAGMGIIFDYNGDDVYRGYKQGRAPASISYHDLPHCGGNFGFVIDYGGKDQYGCGARNNSYNQRASAGGFLIDRPKQEELESEPESAPQTATKEAAGH